MKVHGSKLCVETCDEIVPTMMKPKYGQKCEEICMQHFKFVDASMPVLHYFTLLKNISVTPFEKEASLYLVVFISEMVRTYKRINTQT